MDGGGDEDKVKRTQNPRSNANIFEILTFSWMLNIFKTGRRRDLAEKDLYTTLNSHKSLWLGNELEKKWNLELAIARKSNQKPSLLRVLIQMFGAKYMMYGFLFCLNEIILKMSQPLLIGGLLSYFNPDGPNKTDIIYAYIYAFGLVCNTLFSVFLYVSTQIENLQCGMKMRVACSSIIFRKALRLSHIALGETTEGHMINLLSNDVNRFDLALSTFHYLWISPLQTVIATYFLFQEIGYSAIFGVATYLFFIPLQVWMGKRIVGIRQVTACRTDERLNLMKEFISGIQVIKMYAWEIPFARLIEYARKLEIDQIRGASYIRIVLMSIRPIQIRLLLFISIVSYVLLGNDITIQKVFVVSSFYNLMGRTMGMLRGMDYLAEVLVSIKRLQSFLILEEKDGQESNTSKSVITDTKIITRNDGTRKNTIDTKNNNSNLNSNSVVISAASAKWTDNQIVNTLDNIDLTVKSGNLVAIIGPVGAGKSSLIQVILRELPLTEGTISVHGVVSYASQEPWLFSGSIQQNILFNSPMDEKRYEQVVKSCALLSDFEKFPYGDKTIMGERGVNLSGGQRARINLARAAYKKADIYLLDDPLSAVDTYVGKYVFENCIKDFLKEKTCIFTTHQIHYLPNVDKIVLIENAIILAECTYQELQASDFDFAKLLGSSEKSDSEFHIKEITGIGEDKYAILSPQDINENKLSSSDGSKLKNPKKDEEIRSSGNVLYSIYVSYFSAGGSICKLAIFFLMFIFTQILITGGDYWINFWVKQEEDDFRNEYIVIKENYTSTIHDPYITLMSSLNVRQTCILVYASLIISLIVIWLIRNAVTVSVCMGASINLHSGMFNAIIRATMLFLKTNSSGRISNRFSKDIGAIDDILPKILVSYFQIIMLVVGIIFVVGLVNVYLMLPTLIIGLIFYNIRIYYLATSRSIKRLEGVTKSPVIAHLKESIQGLNTIRAYCAEEALSKEFDKHQDLHSSAWYLFISANEAFGLWLDIVCLIYISVVTFSFIYFNTNAHRGNIGLAITQIITLSGMVQWGIRQSTELENQMISVERVLEYTNTPQEAALQSVPDKKPSKQWPDKGQIVFKNFNLRYSHDTPYVLKNLNFKIHSMEKVGIVGRTGAGKSSLIAALFRLALNEGNIFIDDLEIHNLGLHDLRSKIAIIPQKPVLFSGTIRTNLDPFDEYADHVLWNALDKVEFKTFVEELLDGLNTKMSEDGSNFSSGQRQLFCLARAILRNSKIIILDEATANVDPQTDALIQNTIRNKFQTCTVLTIAHRLNTIMDSDRVMVMDSGNVIEFDHPFDLLKNKDGYFYKMVELTGRDVPNALHTLTKENIYTVKTTLKPLTN